MTWNQFDSGIFNLINMLENISIAKAATEISQYQTNTEYKTEVADTINQKCFQIGKNCTVTFKVKTNQQVRHQPYSLPAEEQLNEIITHYQHQHGESKQ